MLEVAGGILLAIAAIFLLPTLFRWAMPVLVIVLWLVGIGVVVGMVALAF